MNGYFGGIYFGEYVAPAHTRGGGQQPVGPKVHTRKTKLKVLSPDSTSLQVLGHTYTRLIVIDKEENS